MKLILCAIVQNEEDWLPLMLKSVIHGVDKVVLVDSGSTDNTKYVAQTICATHKKELIWIKHKREGVDGDDGIQRNVYLDYLIKNHIGDWALVLDADEIVRGNIKIAITELVRQTAGTNIKCIHLSIKHLIGDLGHEDNTQPEHWVRRRLFEVRRGLHYPETEHNVLQGFEEEKEVASAHGLIVWHFAHVRKSIMYWKRKSEIMREKSNIHTPEGAEWWYYNHLFGTFPRKRINISELPTIIKDEFFINYDRGNMKTLISVGTVPHNTEHLMRCVNNVQAYTHEDHQLLIINNDFKGFAYAHNKALSKVLNDKELNGVVLLNDDCIPKKFDWLSSLRIYPNAIVGVKGSMRESVLGKYLAFYCVYIPRNIIEKIGLLDERFKLGEWEDTDYCKRALDAGFNIHELDFETVDHAPSQTMSDLKEDMEKERQKNKERFYKKWKIEH